MTYIKQTFKLQNKMKREARELKKTEDIHNMELIYLVRVMDRFHMA